MKLEDLNKDIFVTFDTSDLPQKVTINGNRLYTLLKFEADTMPTALRVEIQGKPYRHLFRGDSVMIPGSCAEWGEAYIRFEKDGSINVCNDAVIKGDKIGIIPIYPPTKAEREEAVKPDAVHCSLDQHRDTMERLAKLFEQHKDLLESRTKVFPNTGVTLAYSELPQGRERARMMLAILCKWLPLNWEFKGETTILFNRINEELKEIKMRARASQQTQNGYVLRFVVMDEAFRRPREARLSIEVRLEIEACAATPREAWTLLIKRIHQLSAP